MNELRPDEPDYPARLRRIREQLDMGLSVYVDHCEFATSKKMVIVRASALTDAHLPPVYMTYLLVSWVGEGSMWFPMDIRPNWGYIAEKMRISKWPGDAKSIAAFLWNLSRVGHDEPLLKAEDMD